jgi:hypothetical protein
MVRIGADERYAWVEPRAVVALSKALAGGTIVETSGGIFVVEGTPDEVHAQLAGQPLPAKVDTDSPVFLAALEEACAEVEAGGGFGVWTPNRGEGEEQPAEATSAP